MSKLWKIVGSVLGAMASATAIYVALKQDVKLDAELHYGYSASPMQFSQRLDQLRTHMQYGEVYDRIKNTHGAALDHRQIDALVRMSTSPYDELFKAPFAKGPNAQEARLFIRLVNNGDKVIKDVHIRLPDRALVQMRDDGEATKVFEQPTSLVQIPVITQGASVYVWAHFDGDIGELRSKGINIGYPEGVAALHYYNEYTGWAAQVADNLDLLALSGLLFIVISFAAGYLLRDVHESSAASD